MALDDFAFDLGSLDFSGMSREDVLSALVEAAQRAADDGGDDAGFSVSCAGSPCSEAHFYSPDQPRDHRGRWTAGGGSGGGGTTAEERASARESRHADARAAVAKFLSGKGSPTKGEVAAVAEHLAGMTVKQLQGLRKEHGLKDPRLLKADLVTALHGYFVAHRGKAEGKGEKKGGEKAEPTPREEYPHSAAVRADLREQQRVEDVKQIFYDSDAVHRAQTQLERSDPRYKELLRNLGRMREADVDSDSHPVNREMTRMEVAAVLAAGGKVPPEVLADHPGLAPEPHPLDVAAAGRPGWESTKPIVGGDRAYEHRPTGFRVESHGPLHTVYSPGLSREGTHADAGAAVKAAEGPHGKEMIGEAGEIQQAHRAQAGANLRGKALGDDPHTFAEAVREAARGLPSTFGRPHDPAAARYSGHKVYVTDVYDALKPRLGGMSLDAFKAKLLEGHLAGRLGLLNDDIGMEVNPANAAKSAASALRHPGGGEFRTVDVNAKASPAPAPPAPAAPTPAAGGKGGFDAKAEARALQELGDRHVAAARQAGEEAVAGGAGRNYWGMPDTPRVGERIRAGLAEADAHVDSLVARVPDRAAAAAVAREYGVVPKSSWGKDEILRQLRLAVRERLGTFARLYASAPDPAPPRTPSYDPAEVATFSVAGALPPDQVALARDRRAALEWAERVNARRRTPAGVSP